MDRKNKESAPAAGDKALNSAPAASAETVERIVTFKKVMRGFDPKEVYEYIEVINANLAKAQQVFDEKFQEFKSSYALLARERDNLREEQAVVNEQIAAYKSRIESDSQRFEQHDEVVSQNEQLQEQVRTLYTKLESCKNLVTENQQMKSRLNELELEKKFFEQQKAKYDTEITELREINQKQAYEFAQQKKEIELQYSTERAGTLEVLQQHSYHVLRAEEYLKEFLNQFSKARDSLNDINMK